jgi:outer membrane protein assembly factor BamA
MRIFVSIVKRSSAISVLPFFLLFIIHSPSRAGGYSASNPQDTSRQVVIHSITIDGNQRTRPSIILRELAFHEQDTIRRASFRQMLKAGKENIFNTTLFNFVTLDTVPFQGSPVQMDIVIHVVERWYIWPWPFFEISDRNFNSWIGTTDLSRLSYGIDLTIQNVRGRNETLKFPVHYGFNQKFGFSYRIPYLDRKKIVGIAFGAEYSRNHEIIVETHNNKTVYYKDPGRFPRQNFYAFTELLLRPTFYARHTLHLGFNAWYFSDSLLKIPGYTADSSHNLNYFSIYYQYKNDHRDVQFYPLKGSYFDVEMDQNGLWFSPVNEFFIKTNLRKYLQIYNRWYFASGLTVKVTLTPQPPYFLQRGLGYGRDFVRGYEYYVIDGRNYLLWKNNFKFAVIPQRVFGMDFLRSPKFNKVPFALYLNVFSDVGYVYYDGDQPDKSNDLRNSLLVGYGAGLDLTTYYDIVIRLEVSVNGKGIPGIYLHFTAPI